MFDTRDLHIGHSVVLWWSMLITALFIHKCQKKLFEVFERVGENSD